MQFAKNETNLEWPIAD